MRYVVAILAFLLCTGAQAQAVLKIGYISTMSGPLGGLGVEVRDGFNLGLKHSGGKFGGLEVKMFVGDDQANGDVGRQLIDRFIKGERVHLITGVLASNVHVAVGPAAFAARVPYVIPNGGPSQFAGEGCSPFLSSTAWQNDAYHEAAGQYATTKGLKNVYLLAANYPAGQDALKGFKRFYKGKVVSETYTKLGQLDYATELAQIRAAKPETLYVFLPGGTGIAFIRQFVASGLSKDVSLLLPGFSADQDVIPAVGDSLLGVFNSAHWSPDFDNAENKRFVDEFQKEYKRLPSSYAAQAYDAARLIDAAVRSLKGKIEDPAALAKALRTVKYGSVRGSYTVNVNGYPVQDYYLRVVTKDASGRITNRTMGKIFDNHKDAYYTACKKAS